jgi:large subunit ribosomal protein L25
MKLNVSKRNADKKSEAKQLRRNGMIPAVLYSQGKEGETIAICNNEFQKLLASIQKGHLPTTVFTLVDQAGKSRKAIIKDIQYAFTTYAVLHIDFEEVHEDVPVSLKVPIVYTGVADCVGIKLGGVLRQVIRYLRVKCLPRDIPKNFSLDVTQMKMKETKRLRDIALPEGVRALVTDLNSVVAVIVKR